MIGIASVRRVLRTFVVAIGASVVTALLSSAAASQPASAPGDSLIELPAVTGPHAVGMFTREFADSSRTDTTAGRMGPRPIGVQIWYPAKRTTSGSPAPYAPGIDSTGSDYGRLLSRVRGHARWRARFAGDVRRAPVIVFSTGRSLAAYDYSALAEDLASHGFVVIGVNSPGLSRFVTADGGVIPPAPPPPLAVLRHFDDADLYFEPMIRQVAADLRFVVDRMEIPDRIDPILAGHLDLGRLAMMGHSNGALAASRACASDDRCRACLGIEGTQAREIRKNGTRKPFALLISEQSLGFDTENVYRELGTRAGSPYRVVIVAGAGHNTFTDLLLVRPTLFHYSIDPARGVEITRTVVRGFFDESLRGLGPGHMHDALQPLREVRIQTSF